MKHFLVLQNICEKYSQRGYPHFPVVQQRVTIIAYPRKEQNFFIWKILIEY